jgi:pyridinium-3,5-biscarboxylic acid mononucleotide synthase
MADTEFRLDLDRLKRTGVAEAVYAEGKTAEQIEAIAIATLDAQRNLLFTRLAMHKWEALSERVKAASDYDPRSETIILGPLPTSPRNGEICIVAAGTSDLRVALEAQRTLLFHGQSATLIMDIGVAGLWRLLDQIELIRTHRVIIAVAGMEGALFSVLAGLVDALVIAVPTSIGYGFGEKGAAALSSALASCAPGIVTVNIDNGFGAAAAALKATR